MTTAGAAASSARSRLTNDVLADHPDNLTLLYRGFYCIRRDEALTGTSFCDRRIPVFGLGDGAMSRWHRRRRIGGERRGVPQPAVERLALDDVDELTSWPDVGLDMEVVRGPLDITIRHLRTSFLDGPGPRQRGDLLRPWLRFPMPWPIGPDFPGRSASMVAGSKTLVEA